ncbi:TolC family protein, partial [Pseudomonas guguanensis]|uniref:TolC family protein n=1 Tax=Ectopseudomonas guguanensis TaxID=1198456 RepID=UPI0032656B91
MLSCDGVVAVFYRKLLPALLVSLWMVGRPAVAASSELSLAEALRQAQDNSPALSAASRLVDISLGERQQAGLLPNPELSWEVEDTRSNTRTTTTQITQPIELGGKRGARIELAEKGQSAASVELERSQNGLRADVIQAFYDNLQAKMRVELAEQSLVLAERGVQGAEGRVKAGKVSPVELTRAQVQFSEVRLELRRAQLDQASAQSRLQAVIGGSAEIRVVGSATSIPKPPTINQLWSA